MKSTRSILSIILSVVLLFMVVGWNSASYFHRFSNPR